MSHREIIEGYYRHVTSSAEWRDRDAMLEAIWPGVGQSWAAQLQIFGDGPLYMERYEHESLSGARRPPMRMAEFIRFEGDMIAEIEVLFGRELI